jgi:hypothetical protein
MDLYLATRRHISEDSTVLSHGCDNLEWSNLYIFIFPLVCVPLLCIVTQCNVVKN